MRKLFVVFLLLFTSAAFGDDCSCKASFDSLTAQIETNYIAYRLDAAMRARYLEAKPSFQQRAEQTAPEQCYRVLQSFVAVLRDGHTFIAEFPERPAPPPQTLDVTEAGIRAAKGRRDPIEGIWYAADGSRFGIVRRGKNKFTAVVLQTPAANWKAGQIKAEYTKLDDGSYDVTLYNDDHQPVHPFVYSRDARGGAKIRYGLLLHMPPVTWGKEFPVSDSVLDPKNPRAPTFRMFDAKTAVFFVPSHSPEHHETLEALVAANRDKIAGADTLIIDIRGDEGGSSTTTAPLEPFYRSARKSPPEADRTVALSSPVNNGLFEKMVAQGWPSKDFLERLKANPGAIVPLEVNAAAAAEEPAETMPRPKHVAILVDRAVVSAGEAFVQIARPFEKVTIFGDNTGGTIDYQMVWMRRAGCSEIGLVFGYPRFAASPDLPRGGVNSTGIAPDVRIPRGKDPIRFIAEYYRSR